MNKLTIPAVATALGVLLSVPGVALAQETTTPIGGPSTTVTRPEPRPDFDQRKDRALAAIRRRLATIDRLETAVNGSEHVTDEHAATLSEQLAVAEAGLSELATQIEAATTLEELEVLAKKIVDDYRIYVLVVPKVHLVLGADAMVDAAGRMSEVAGELQAKIDELAGAGYDVAQAQALLDEMESEVASAEGLAGGVPAAVIGLTAGDWPDPAQGALGEARADLGEASTDLRQARDLARQVVEALRNLAGE